MPNKYCVYSMTIGFDPMRNRFFDVETDEIIMTFGDRLGGFEFMWIDRSDRDSGEVWMLIRHPISQRAPKYRVPHLCAVVPFSFRGIDEDWDFNSILVHGSKELNLKSTENLVESCRCPALLPCIGPEAVAGTESALLLSSTQRHAERF
jgi:hypothetical protein